MNDFLWGTGVVSRLACSLYYGFLPFFFFFHLLKQSFPWCLLVFLPALSPALTFELFGQIQLNVKFWQALWNQAPKGRKYPFFAIQLHEMGCLSGLWRMPTIADRWKGISQAKVHYFPYRWNCSHLEMGGCCYPLYHIRNRKLLPKRICKSTFFISTHSYSKPLSYCRSCQKVSPEGNFHRSLGSHIWELTTNPIMESVDALRRVSSAGCHNLRFINKCI